MSLWYRIGNFYRQFTAFNPFTDDMDAIAVQFICEGDGRSKYHGLLGGRLVVFRNSLPACVISQIIVADRAPNKGQLTFELLVSNVNHVNEIANILKASGNSIYVKNRSITIFFPGQDDIDTTFFQAWRMIDARFNVHEFTPDIKAELHSICYFDTGEVSATLGVPKNFHQHIIPARQLKRYSHYNPYSHRSKRFKNALERAVVNMRELKYLLLTGEDPNLCSENDMPPILYAMQHHDETVLELILLYGGDPRFRRDFGHNGKYVNAIEFGLENNLLNKVDLIYRHLSYLDRTLNPNPGELAKVTMTGDLRGVTTVFDFPNKIIRTELKRVDQLSLEERGALLEQYKRCFESKTKDSDAAIVEVFNKDFSGPGKLAECIYQKIKANRKDTTGVLIGLNLFELLISKAEKNLLYVHCICSMVDPSVRSQGFMAVLAFRIGFALDKILPGFKIGNYYAALTHDSWGMIKDILHFPMRQTRVINNRVREVTQITSDGKIQITHDLLTCYYKESVAVKRSFTKKFDDNPFIRFFYREFLNLPPNTYENDEMRAVPVFFYVADESEALLSKKAGLMGVNFSQHTLELAGFFMALLVDMLNIKTPNPTPSTLSRSMNALFYCDIDKPGNPPNIGESAPIIAPHRH